MTAKTDAQLERLAALKAAPSSVEAQDAIEKALRGKNSLVAAKTAAIVEAAKLDAHEVALVTAFETFLAAGCDKGCLAKTAIAKALHAIAARSEGTLLIGARHVQMEGTWGGSSDVAVELRIVSVAALVNMRSRRAMEMIVHLLADGDPSARSAAVRSIAAHGGDAAEALVRYKLLVGDREPAVIAECLPGAISLTRSLDPVLPFLDSDDEGLREAAILMVGESRLPGAFELLRDRWDGEFNAEARKLLAMSIGLTRHPAGVEFLIQQVEQADAKSACVAVEALALYRHDDAVRERMREFGENRGGVVQDAVRKQLSG